MKIKMSKELARNLEICRWWLIVQNDMARKQRGEEPFEYDPETYQNRERFVRHGGPDLEQCANCEGRGSKEYALKVKCPHFSENIWEIENETR
jgi:hypothetical protein